MALIKRRRNGTTLVELMVVIAILGIIFSVGPKLLTNVFKLWKTNEARVDVQMNARTTIQLIQGLLRKAEATSIIISRQDATEPPYSKISFTIPKGDSCEFYQLDNELWINHVSATATTHNRVLAKNLRFVSFGFPQISEDSLLSVAVCFQKTTVGDETKDFYLSTQRVQVMNT